MAGLRCGLKGAFAVALPEKRIFIQTADRTRMLQMTSGAQALIAATLIVAVGWLAVATTRAAVDLVAAEGGVAATAVVHDAFAARLDALTAERDARAAEVRSAQTRFQSAMAAIGRQQTRLLDAVAGQRELEAALAATRSRLHDAMTARDAVADANGRLIAQMTEAAAAPGASPADLAVTLEAVTAALSDAVIARDDAAGSRETLAAELAAVKLRYKIATRRHEEMLDEVQTAVSDAFGPLESLLERADLDVDSMLASVRADYSGQGGPLVSLGMSTRSFDGEVSTTSRFDTLMVGIDRMNMLRIAIGKVPYAIPVKDVYRFTSGYGTRRDPKGGGRRLHAGVDFAAPRGTPIYATADGVVSSAETEGGYGRTVRIRHDFGFETVYAHQSRLRVTAGQRVSRGDHIGDMGSTGRSTGVHLHYEVRLNGRPVNPMSYVEAAKDVF